LKVEFVIYLDCAGYPEVFNVRRAFFPLKIHKFASRPATAVNVGCCNMCRANWKCGIL